MATLTKYDLSAYSYGGAVIYNPDLNEVWMAGKETTGIVRVNPTNGSVIGTIAATLVTFDYAAYNPVLKQAYFSTWTSNTYYVFDTLTATFVATRTWRINPIGVNPANGHLWSIALSGGLYYLRRLNPTSNTPFEEYLASSGADGNFIAFSADGDGWYIDNFSRSDPLTFLLKRFQTGVGIIATYTVTVGVSNTPSGLIYDPDRNSLWIPLNNTGGTGLVEFDVPTLGEEAQYTVSPGIFASFYPNFLYDAVRQLVWCGDTTLAKLVALNTGDATTFTEVSFSAFAGFDVNFLAQDTTQDVLWVAGSSDGSLIKVGNLVPAYSPLVGSLTLAGVAPTLFNSGTQVISPPVGALSLLGNASTVPTQFYILSDLVQGQVLAQDNSAAFQIIRHPTATPLQIITGSTTDDIDITQFVNSIRQGQNETSLKCSWHMEWYQTGQQPQIDELIEIRRRETPLWVGVIQAIQDYGEERGGRSLTLTCRSRDASPLWREVHLVGNVYSIATDIAVIVRDLLSYLGLTSAEYVVPTSLGTHTVHTSTQMADMTVWDMLQAVLAPAGYEPFVDAIGMFRLVSREVGRATTHVLTTERIVAVKGGKQKARTNKVKIKWLDPNLTKTTNQDQVLGHATITAGFFQLRQRQDIHFSDDRTQRAENTYLVIKQSCNSGLLSVADEDYEQIDLFHGRITLTTHFWVPLLATASIVIMLAYSSEPDGVAGSATVPIGRIVHDIAEAVIMVIMMSIGTGVYEVWGTPFDYVHAVNTTEAYDDSVPAWAQSESIIENDFVMHEEQAQAFAVRELIYVSRSASSYSLDVVDDTTLMKGSILELPDGSRLYVTDTSRDLERGKAFILQVEGFRV